MKIGIISLFGEENFGNKLQSYATQKIVDRYGESEIIVNIYADNKKEFLKKYIMNKVKSLIKGILDNRPVTKRVKAFKKFSKQYLKYAKRIEGTNSVSKKLENEFDYFIFGSDQVWNPYAKGDSDLYLGKFTEKNNKISLAASFGIEELPQEKKENYKNAINKFKKISLREDAGKKIVQNLTSREDAVVIVDPTMLLTKKEWQVVSKKTRQLRNEKYILNYFLGELSEERKNCINDLAEKNGWKVINILDPNDPFYVSGPSEFIYLEEHAELICTDSFHSCVFGILMNTPFMVFDREDKEVSMNSRLETLLSKFDLEDRYYKGELNESHLKCDYTKTYKILEEERKKANDFLNKALDIE